MVYSVAESLARFGFNPQEKITSPESFQKQRESYALHVIEDLPVSNIYSYYYKDGKVFIDPNFQTELLIDREERDGLALEGAMRAIETALDKNNLGEIVALYSPPGPVAFRPGTKYDRVKPYPAGQLSLLIGNEGNRVDCLAITVGQENENQILDIFLEKQRVEGFADPKTRIIHYLANPYLLGKTIDDLIRHLNKYDPNIVVYTNVHQDQFTLGKVIRMIVLGWDGKIKPKIEIKPEINLPHLSFNTSALQFPALPQSDRSTSFFYHQMLDAYTSIYGDSYPLGGGCGGTVYSKETGSMLSSVFSELSIYNFNPLATAWRTIFALGEKENDRYSFDHEGICFHCHQGPKPLGPCNICEECDKKLRDQNS